MPLTKAMHAVAAGEVEVAEDRVEQHLGDLAGRGERHPAPAGLAVDADADLHLVLGQVEGRLAGGRHGAGREGHAHAAAVGVDLARATSATSARLRPCSAAAPAIFSSSTVTPTPRRPAVYRLSCTATSSSVTTDDHLDAGLGGGHLGGHLEVHHVAGVVLHDVQDAGAAVDGFGRLEHLVRHRRGEHLPAQAASSIPIPTNPPCSGSWPEPPPEISPTLPATGASPR